MKIPIISGIYTDNAGDYRTAYPRNMVPVTASQGISNEYLRPADGIVPFTIGRGADRGAINWNDECYRVSGPYLIKISETGTVTELSNIYDGGQCSMDYSYDHLGVSSNGILYLYDGVTVTPITDPKMGYVLDFIYISGYWMATDGENIVVTDIDDPFKVNLLRYGSSEADPDPVLSLIRLRNEAVALNRYTIETFANVGARNGVGQFPFSRIAGAQIQRGTVGTHANCEFRGTIAFVGSGRNESISVYIGTGGTSRKIATPEIERILSTLTNRQLTEIIMEKRVDAGHEYIYIHLPDQTLVYDAASSQAIGAQIWHTLTSGITGKKEQYRARNIVYCYNKWIAGDPVTTNIGYMDRTISSHYGDEVYWEYSTPIIYNNSRGAIIHDIEIVALTGRSKVGENPTVYTSHSDDGLNWSVPWGIPAGKTGNRAQRLIWYQQGFFQTTRIQKFFGTSEANISVSGIVARIEPLDV